MNGRDDDPDALAQPISETARRWLRLGGILITAGLCAALAIALAATVSAMETRYMLALIVGLSGLVAMPLVGSCQRVRDLLIVSFCLGLSVGFSISFMHRTLPLGRYVPFMGGAQAITVSLTMVSTAMYIAVWMFERMFYAVRRPVLYYWPLVWPSIAFMVAGLLSLVNTLDAPLTWLEELRLVYLLIVTVVAMNFSAREVDIYFWMLGATITLQAGLAAAQFATGGSLGLGVFGEAAPVVAGVDFERVSRPTGTIGDPNILAYFFELTTPVTLALLYTARNRLEQLFFLAVTGAGIAGTVVTLSRAAWMALPVTCGLITLAVYGRRLLSLRTAIIGMGLTLTLAAGLSYFYPLIVRRLFGDDAGSTAQRMPLNRAALLVIEQFPVFGVGLNNFAITFTNYDSTGYSRVLSGVDYVVHNLFLLVWTEVGTVGLVAFLWYFGSVYLTAYRLRHAEPRTRAVALGIALGLAAHWLHGMVDPGYRVNLTISQLIAAQIGIAGWLAMDHRRRTRQAPPAG